ncbi:LysR family transcriptional regulator [Cytobacillus horneckiae]|uniref:LysR family transcriptional regulator n=1 Tax=Cytobacillus horneckiae TaxID=549687 RepID=A0A2N0ZFP3_9BACI|nr:LysR family transcriptional regulator [Cytobacillus horneckiae]MEC1154342.1 LysR family transcriptional regulator [Cytobacillus horneckiae]MED2937678.1 LysR family transcriptional regulator [Cytobacillus horneckiae]PKG28326.1 LysR family transcriptional regulator [Cytobacillus horneckiae]
MNDKDWLILKTVAEENNITKAAERLYISQPALTYRINQIEQDVKVQILERKKKGIKFTDEGKFLVQYANEMLHRLQHVQEELANMSDRTKGIIRIGVSSNYARIKLPPILQSFLEQYDRVQFSVITGWSDEIYKRLQQEDIRMAIIRGENDWHHDKILLERDAVAVISKEPILIEELPSLPRITYQTEPKLQQLIDDWWKEQYQVPPNITMEIDNIETCKKLVANGLGYAIVPSLGLSQLENIHAQTIQAKNGDNIERETWLLYKQEDIRSTVSQAFIDFLREREQA